MNLWQWIQGLWSGKADSWMHIDTTPIDMKYLIVGLGNIGAEYDNTRHNIGFEVVDSLAIKINATWKTDKLGSLAQGKYRGKTIILLKPSTYMNRSGKAVRYWMDKLKIKQDNLLVVVDDIHMDYGKHRLRTKGSDAGHNGLKDIQDVLQGSKYPRLKVGIGSDFHPGQQVKYVLGQWTRKEEESLQYVIIKAADMCLSFIGVGASHTMNQHND